MESLLSYSRMNLGVRDLGLTLAVALAGLLLLLLLGMSLHCRKLPQSGKNSHRSRQSNWGCHHTC